MAAVNTVQEASGQLLVVGPCPVGVGASPSSVAHDSWWQYIALDASVVVASSAPDASASLAPAPGDVGGPAVAGTEDTPGIWKKDQEFCMG